MTKVIRLKESDIKRMVKRVVNEQESTPSKKEKFKGYVQFVPYATGTKSESIRPSLFSTSGKPSKENYLYQLLFVGDSPYQNKSLQPYDGKYVEVTGIINTYNNSEMTVLDVKEINDSDIEREESKPNDNEGWAPLF